MKRLSFIKRLALVPIIACIDISSLFTPNENKDENFEYWFSDIESIKIYKTSDVEWKVYNISLNVNIPNKYKTITNKLLNST